MKRRPRIVVLMCLPLLIMFELSGLTYRLRERDYFSEFDYPFNGDVAKLVDGFQDGVSRPLYDNHKYSFKLLNVHKCRSHEKLRVVYVVKSSIDNFARRSAIRKTWGFEGRFSDVSIRTVFLVGGAANNPELEQKIDLEFQAHGGDIVQGNFIDSYYNNTLKALMGLGWAKEHCSNARFYMFVDDDYYVSTKNLLMFLRNPANYPRYLEDPTVDFDDVREQNFRNRKPQQLLDFDLPDDVILYAGYVLFARPHRHYFGKWSLSIAEYPFSRYPPYITAGAYALSKEVMKRFHAATFFVKKFIFDDVYLGILAKKINVEPFHCENFWMNRKHPYEVRKFRYTIASHEFSDPQELEKVWTEQKHAGNA